MQYERIEDKLTPGAWRVEAIDDEGDGQVYVATFSGPDAKFRAGEYVEWKGLPRRKKYITWGQAVRRELPGLKTYLANGLARYFMDKLGYPVPLRPQIRRQLSEMDDRQLRSIYNVGNVGLAALKEALGR